MGSLVATSVDLPVRRLVALAQAVRVDALVGKDESDGLWDAVRIVRYLTQAGENELASQEAQDLLTYIEDRGAKFGMYQTALQRRTLNVVKACR